MVKWQREKAPNKKHKLHSNPGSRLCWERGSLGSECTRRPTNRAFSSLRFDIQGELDPLDLKISKFARMGRVGNMLRHPRVTRTQHVHSIHALTHTRKDTRACTVLGALVYCLKSSCCAGKAGMRGTM